MLICAATNNAKKLQELKRILEKQGHIVKSLKELNVQADPEETGDTFEQNAMIKAREICKLVDMPVIADDSGLMVDILKGEPGVRSARYSGIHGDDQANNATLIKNLQLLNVSESMAQFVCMVCMVLPNGKEICFKGVCEGKVVCQPKGENGFGYDPLFIPKLIEKADGTVVENTENFTYAQLESWQKDAISHRGQALQLLEQNLMKFLQETS